MILRKKRNRILLPTWLIVGLVVSTSPAIDGCSRGNEQPAAPAASAQPSVAAPPPAAQAPPTMAPSPMPTANPAAMQPGPAPGAATAEELQQLVSPIALYPDILIAQILAASTYPTQVVEADRFMKANPSLTGDALAAQVNPQPWDPSVKSLCQFPSVLSTMSQSLAWTSALGEAYYNQPDDVLAAVQVMRKRAMAAGTLKSTPQQKVEVQTAPVPAAPQGGTQQPAQQQVVVVQPAQTNTVYVPQYNPTTVYGAPVAQPAGYSGTEVLAAGVLGFGAGVLLGALINNGHNDWGCNWYGGNVVYNRNVWVSNSAFVAGRWGYPGYRPGYPGYRPGYPGFRPGYPGYGPGYPGNRPGYPGNRPGYPGGYPRPMPYGGKGPQFAANNPNLRPNFPKPETLPNRPNRPANKPGGNRGANRPGGNVGGNRLGSNVGAGRPGGNLGSNRPGNVGGKPGTGLAGNRPGGKPGGGGLAANRPAPTTRPANNPMRGYGGLGRANQGGRNGAFGGYQPGGFAQASSNRGKASFGGGRGFGGGGGRGGGGGFGGGGRRGGGGGGRRR